MRRSAFITVDAGTTFCKALVWSAEGAVLARAERMNQLLYPRPGWAEQAPQRWWENSLAAARDALAQAAAGGGPLEVAALALTSCRDILIPVDRRGEPLANAILWMDTRAKAEAEQIACRLGAETVHRTTGMIPGPTFPACKLLWLRRHRPEQLAGAACWLQPRDYVFHGLTGELLTDHSMASRTMLYDQQTGGWWPEICELAGVEAGRLPQLDGALTTRPLRAKAARMIGLPAGTPVVLGGGDRQCEALGAAVSAKRAMDSTGTATNISLSAPRAETPHHPRIVRSVHVVPGELLMEVTINTSGLAMEYFRKLLGGGEDFFQHMETEAADIPPGAGGLVVLPFFMGARSVRWNPRAAGVIFGLSPAHGAGHIVRALMEAIAFEERNALEVFRQMGFAPAEIRALGGGSQSALWNRIKADVSGLPVVTLAVSDVASFGALALARAAVGAAADPRAAAAEMSRVAETYSPEPGATERYREIFDLYMALYDANEKLFDRLEKLKRD